MLNTNITAHFDNINFTSDSYFAKTGTCFIVYTASLAYLHLGMDVRSTVGVNGVICAFPITGVLPIKNMGIRSMEGSIAAVDVADNGWQLIARSSIAPGQYFIDLTLPRT